MYAIEKARSIEVRWDLVFLAGALMAALALAAFGPGAHLLKEAAGIPDSAEGFGRIKTMAKAIQTPALFTAGALIPLILIGGAIALMIGSRQATTYIARAVAALFLLAIVILVVVKPF